MLLENGDGRFAEEAHERRGEVPFVGVLGDDVEPVDREEAVSGEHHANEDGARDREAFAAHDTSPLPCEPHAALVIGRPLPRSSLPVSPTDTIRYDTRCYFNVRSKADMSQLNLPHGNNN